MFFGKQDTAYELRMSDWSSDVCSSDRFDLIQPPIDGEHILVSRKRSGVVICLKFKVAELFETFREVDSPEGALWISFQKASPSNDAFLVSRNRSVARRVWKECVSTCRSRWSRYHIKHTKHNHLA